MLFYLSPAALEDTETRRVVFSGGNQSDNDFKVFEVFGRSPLKLVFLSVSSAALRETFFFK